MGNQNRSNHLYFGEVDTKKDYDVDTFICAAALEEALSLKDIWPDI